MVAVKRKAKKRVSAKSRLMNIYVDLETARQLQLALQEKLVRKKSPRDLRHNSAMIGNFIARACEKIERALK